MNGRCIESCNFERFLQQVESAKPCNSKGNTTDKGIHQVGYYLFLPIDISCGWCVDLSIHNFNYDISIIMMRIAIAIGKAFYHPRILRLNLKQNRQKESSRQEIERDSSRKKLQLSEELRFREKEKKQKEEQLNLYTLRRKMQEEIGASRGEQLINRLIKTETKVSSLHKLHKTRHLEFTPRNLVNLLVKIIELRQINQKQQQNDEKLHALVNMLCRRVVKFSPEEMIRILHAFKKVKCLSSDFILTAPLISVILKEFSARTNETSMGSGKEFQSLYVISLQTNIKLLHSLTNLHQMAGSEFDPLLPALIKSSLHFFYSITISPPKDRPLHNPKTIPWSFYLSFLRMAAEYSMPTEVLVVFIRILSKHKQSYRGHYSYLFQIEELLHTLPALKSCRGKAIIKHKETFQVHLSIYEQIQKPNELLRMRPLHLLSHAQYLSDFTQEEVQALGFSNLRNTTLERILKFTLKTYQKFFMSKYVSQEEKETIEKWAQDGESHKRDFLGEFILTYRKLVADKLVVEGSEVLNKLVHLCQQHFESLTQQSQLVLLRVALEEQPTACKPLLDVFFGRGHKESQWRKYKKDNEVLAYAHLFTHWKSMSTISNIIIDPLSDGCFLRFFFLNLTHHPNLQQLAQQFAIRVSCDRHFFSILVKKYVQASDFNRSLGKTFSEQAQSPQFKRELNACKVILASAKQDMAKLNEFWELKNLIRLNMMRGLTTFRFMCLMLEELKAQTGSQANLTSTTLFKELFSHFNEEIKCLHFKQLMTQQIYDLANTLSTYLQSRESLPQTSQLYKMTHYDKAQLTSL